MLWELNAFDYDLLLATNALIESDAYTLTEIYKSRMEGGLYPKNPACQICGTIHARPHNRNDVVKIFPCGHAYHGVCLGIHKHCQQCMMRVGKSKIDLAVLDNDSKDPESRQQDERKYEELKKDLVMRMCVYLLVLIV
jgi:hypothetical protein